MIDFLYLAASLSSEINLEDTLKSAQRIIAISSLLILFAPLGIDLYLSAFKIIENDLSDSFFQVSDTLTIYIFTLGLGQLFFGGLSDRYGHQIIIAAGFFLTALSCLLIVSAGSMEFFMLCRFLQGLGASALTVVSFAQIRENFKGVESARAYSIVNGCMNIIPTLAPFIGSYFIFGGKWQGVFYALLFFSITIGVIIFVLVWNNGENNHNRSSIISFVQIASDSNFQKGVLINSLLLSVIFTYVATAPKILMNEMNFSASSFGLIFGLNAAVIMFFSFIQSKILQKVSPKKSIVSSVSLILFSSILLVFFSSSTAPLTYMFSIAVFSIGFGSLTGIASAIAMDSFADNPGKASALMGCTQMMLSSFISSLLAHSPINPRLSLSYFMLGTAIFLGFLLQKRLEGTFNHAR